MSALPLRKHFEGAEAEQAVLGAAIVDGSVAQALAHLRPDHFTDALHGRTWSAIAAVAASGRAPSPINVRAQMRGDAALVDLDQAVGGDFLTALALKAPASTLAPDFAQIVIDDWERARVVAAAQRIMALAADPAHVPALELISEARKEVEALDADIASSDTGFELASDVAASVFATLAENARSGKSVGKRCGLRCIDHRCCGLHPGALIVLGGRPGMGKTALGRAIAHGAAVRNPTDQVLFLGIEMGPAEMMERELSAITHEMGDAVEYRDMSRGALPPHDLVLTQRAIQHVPANLILKDCPSLGVDDIRRFIWARKRTGPLALVVIDYLQLMRRPDARGRNDAAVIGDITMALKQLARQAGCTIVLLSQLSRQVEARDDKRPMLSDLRESGAIEQDADFVLFPYREAYYLERAKPKAGKETEHDMEVARLQRVMEVICAKARRGAVGIDRQTYYAEYDHISDWSPE